MDDDTKKLTSSIFATPIYSPTPNPGANKFYWAFEQDELKKKMMENWVNALDYVPFSGVKIKTVSFDEVAEGWGDMPKKKSVAGKWMPTRKDGKLVADGMVVRRGDSDVPDGLATDQTKKDTAEKSFQPMPMLKLKDSLKYPNIGIFDTKTKPGKIIGPVTSLAKVKEAYDNILASAKNANMHPHEFAIAIKPLGNAAKGVVPISVVKAIESATVSKYSEYYFDMLSEALEPNDEEVK